jgi:alkylation response protein AidB-like acyl-CoA dehydrogenase
VFEANIEPARVLALLGSEELQQRFLPDVVTGNTTIGLAISEPDASAAATDITTRAKCADGAYTVNGAKRWTSNGGEADAYLVYARMSDEPGARGWRGHRRSGPAGRELRSAGEADGLPRHPVRRRKLR